MGRPCGVLLPEEGAPRRTVACPSAALEPAPAVLVPPTESLHHAVDGDVRHGRRLHDRGPPLARLAAPHWGPPGLVARPPGYQHRFPIRHHSFRGAGLSEAPALRCRIGAAWFVAEMRVGPGAARQGEERSKMTRYLIAFDDGDMKFPQEELPAVAKAAQAVVEEASAAGAWVFGAGLEHHEVVTVVDP